jgi:hypothetical protein
MAVQTWEEILAAAQLSADERKLLDNIVQKVPEFKDGRLRQADYSRYMTELTARKSEYDKAVETAAKWDAWADEKQPLWNKLKENGAVDDDGNLLWLTEKRRLADEVETLKKQVVAGGDVDPKELDRRINEIVKANGGVTREEMTALVASEARKLAAETVNEKYKGFETNFNEKTIPFVAGFSTAMAVQAARYEKETGKDFTADVQKEYFDLMAKEQKFDPYVIGELVLKPIRAEKASKAEVERLANERAEAIVKERGGLPGSGNEPYIPQGGGGGTLQKMLELSKSDNAKLDVETRLQDAVEQGSRDYYATAGR